MNFQKSYVFWACFILSIWACNSNVHRGQIDFIKKSVKKISSDTILKQVLLTNEAVDATVETALLSGYFKNNELLRIQRCLTFSDTLISSDYYFDDANLIYASNLVYRLAYIDTNLKVQDNYDTITKVEYYIIKNKAVPADIVPDNISEKKIYSQYLLDLRDINKYSLMLKKVNTTAANKEYL